MYLYIKLFQLLYKHWLVVIVELATLSNIFCLSSELLLLEVPHHSVLNEKKTLDYYSYLYCFQLWVFQKVFISTVSHLYPYHLLLYQKYQDYRWNYHFYIFYKWGSSKLLLWPTLLAIKAPSQPNSFTSTKRRFLPIRVSGNWCKTWASKYTVVRRRSVAIK